MQERFQDIRVRAGTAAKDSPQNRYEQLEIVEISRTPNWIVRFAEVQDEKPCIGSRNTPHLQKAGFQIRKISQAVRNRYNIEGIIRKRQPQCVGLDESRQTRAGRLD